MVVTTLSMGALLPVMRDVFRAQLAVDGKLGADFGALLKQFLGRISISRVFDVAGLWEALGELDSLASHDGGGGDQEPPGGQHEGDTGDDEVTVEDRHGSLEDGKHSQEVAPSEVAEPPSSPLSDPPSSLPEEFEFKATLLEETPPPGQRTEIADSEDEDGLSPLSPPEDSPQPSVEAAKSVVAEEEPAGEQPDAQGQFSVNKPKNQGPSKQEDQLHPDIILITHISTLLSSLFRQREKDTAHQMLQLLSSHLRYLTRSPDHGGPLVMILNSTTSPPDTTANSDAAAAAAARPQDPDRPPRPAEPGTNKPRNRRPAADPTLRSIFNPPPLPASGLSYAHDTPLSRRNKPSFGLVFTQLLDAHLLCTGVPRTRADAEALYAPPGGARGEAGGAVGYGWAVEVLLDEVGVWGGLEGGGPRRSREQRWGAVEVWRGEGGGGGGGVRVVDAFEWREKFVPEIRLAGGFGGRRV